LWGTDAHNKIIERAFPGLNPILINAIEQGSESVDDLSTSPAHAGWQVWDPIGNPAQILDHGNGFGSIEGVNALTPALLQQTVNLIHASMK